jgi:putative FmdB family regulatory protein
MPIYEYQCLACEHELEVLQKVSDKPLQECPDCGEPALKKKVSAAAFRLKGGGWYETDFKTGDKKNIAGDSAPSESAAPASDGGGDKGSSSDRAPSGEKSPGKGEADKTGSGKSDSGKQASSKSSSGSSSSGNSSTATA